MDLLLSGKLALVTGSTAGIGFAIAEGLAREGSTSDCKWPDRSSRGKGSGEYPAENIPKQRWKLLPVIFPVWKCARP